MWKMIITRPGIDIIKIDDQTVKDKNINNKKIHLIEIDFEYPSHELLEMVVEK